MSSILIIDDEDKYFELCRRYMPEHHFLPPARNYRQAAEILRRRSREIELVLLDVHFNLEEDDLLPHDKSALWADGDRSVVLERLRRGQGLHILDQLRHGYPDLPVIVMTSRNDLPLEADAERLNAQDYTYLLDDDYLDARSLRLQIEGILTRRDRPNLEEEPFFWGSTPAMLRIRRRLAILARGQLPIILQGATGTGKSLLARDYIHVHSGRTGPFVAVDLSTVPTDLMGAHLFGVVKGAYTGATTSRDGLLSRAHGGTLLLDEIGNLGLELQKSLLLVLQEGRYRPVGSVDERVVDLKLVVASNVDLSIMVQQGRFREDLYMRLNPATAVTLPTLRERRDDFRVLLLSFMRRVVREPYNRDLLRQYAEQRGLAIDPDLAALPVSVGTTVPAHFDPHRIHFLFHPSSYKLMQESTWPGNFRQFEMVLSNLTTLTLVELVDRAEQVEPEDPHKAGRPDVIPLLPRTVRELLGARPEPTSSPGSSSEGRRPSSAPRLEVEIQPRESLNAVSCEVERQYLEQLYQTSGGDLSRVAEVLLGNSRAARKVQLRMNQLGIKLRRLRQRTRA